MLMFLALSVIFLFTVNIIAYSREGSGIGWAVLCSVGGVFVLFFPTMSFFLPLNALFVAVAGIVCWAVKARPRWFLASSLGATVSVYAIIGLADFPAWDRLKNDYPLESLAERLAYEDQARPPSLVGRDDPPGKTTATKRPDVPVHGSN